MVTKRSYFYLAQRPLKIFLAVKPYPTVPPLTTFYKYSPI